MPPLIVESWIWWSIVIVVGLARFISRRMTFGAFKRFQADDYLMLAVLCLYTTLIVTINIVAHTNSNLLPPGFDINTLTPSDIHSREYGSKLILVVEQCQCATIWGAKACLVILYLRLTTFSHRTENIAIRVLAAYIGISWVVMEICYFGVWCRPFRQYWAVPTNNIQCDAAINHLILNAVFNLTSDCAMLAIGMPMFLRMQLPWKKKVPLILIFSLGIFVVLAAVLNKVYSFSEPFGDLWPFWYVRESSTALLVANLPFVWGVVKKITRMDSIDGESRRNTMESVSPAQGEQGEKRRKESLLTFSGFSSKRSSGKGSEELQMTGATNSKSVRSPRTRNGLTLEQMLGESRSDLEDDEPDLYTSPARYFARKTGGDHVPLPPMERVLTNDSHETVRYGNRNSGPTSGASGTSGTQASSNLPSLNSPSLNSERLAGQLV